jgi:hypothetical protein
MKWNMKAWITGVVLAGALATTAAGADGRRTSDAWWEGLHGWLTDSWGAWLETLAGDINKEGSLTTPEGKTNSGSEGGSNG